MYENPHHLATQRTTLPKEGNIEKDGGRDGDRREMDTEEADEDAEENCEGGEELYAKVSKFHGADVSLKSLSKYVTERLRSKKLYEEFSVRKCHKIYIVHWLY